LGEFALADKCRLCRSW